MKKTPQFTRLLTPCMVLLLLVVSCQKEDIAVNENNENLQRKSAPSSATSFVIDPNLTFVDYTDCVSACIEPGATTYYTVSGSDTRSAGPNTKLVSYRAYNTETQFVLDVHYAVTSGSSGAQVQITMDINGDIVVLNNVVSGSTVTHTIDLPADWQACDEISFSVLQEGLSTPITFNNTYALVGVCETTCDESFSYEINDDGSYDFTYVSPEDLNAAEIKFTCPHIVSFEALDGRSYTVNPGNGNGSPTVLTWTGNIAACTPIIFTLHFDADCNQNNAGFANVFTDFKVNGVSKKGDNSNIRLMCP